MHPDLLHHEHTLFELDFSELMVPSDLDFLKYFEPSMHHWSKEQRRWSGLTSMIN